ncbi:tribbles homolog 2-like [Diretmus argenteus]
MSVGVATARSHVCLKRLSDEPQDNFLKCKKACLAAPPSSPGLSSCFRPRSPAPQPIHSQSLSSIGPYFLVEPCNGAETYRAVHTHTQQQYTCKVLPLCGYQERLAPYARLGHHINVCGLSDVVIGQDSVYLFLPGHHGDMHAYVRERKRLGEEETRRLFTQMLNAVAHCHQHGVVLRDLKLRKFIFTDTQGTRLALQNLDDSVLLHDDRDDSLTDRHGCPAYVGPELLTNGNTSYSGRAADIWSLGVSLYTMLIGRYPFQDTQPAALFAKIRRGTFSLPHWLSPQAKCLIGCMLRKSPAERLEAAELLMHPWLTNPYTDTTPLHHNAHTLHHNAHTLHHNAHTLHHNAHTLHHNAHTLHHNTHTLHHNAHAPHQDVHSPHHDAHPSHHNAHTPHHDAHTPHQDVHSPHHDVHTPHHDAHPPHQDVHSPHHDAHTPHHDAHPPHQDVHSPHHDAHPSHHDVHSPHHNVHTPHRDAHPSHHDAHPPHHDAHKPQRNKQCNDDQVVPTFTEQS